MMDVYGGSGITEFKHWTIFGDASLMVRTAEPAAMAVTHNAEILTGDNTFNVNAGVEEALVCLYDGSQIIASDYTPASGNVTLLLNPVPDTPQDLTLTITAYNKITWQETIPVINPAGTNVVIESSSVTAGEDEIIDPSETVYLSVTLHNSGSETATNVSMTISETDSYITLLDSSQSFGSINSGSSVLQNDAFSFSVADDIPDEYPIALNCSIICDESDWNYQILLAAHNPPAISVEPDHFDLILATNVTSSSNLMISNSGGATLDYTVTVIPDWLSLNGGNSVSGNIIMGDPQDEITVVFNTGILSGGIYEAEITTASNDPVDPVITTPVTLTVLGAPSNIIVEVEDNNILLSWDQVEGASSYKIYSTSTPDDEDTFELQEIVSSEFNSRSYLVNDSKQFFRVVASTEPIGE
ncbi:MAG: hypothetical protein APR54_11885 [Candidatus Cloacimonas sp. SDB]|nr:MAG: hypothetical protein APR54_11885 [Candidatus Cloacimonas sp. SDB]